jgi:hypothetical protein
MMSPRPFGLQRGLERRDQGQVTGCERRHANNVHIVFHRLPGGFLRCGKQRADIHIEADIGKGGCDHLLAAIMAVLAHLGDQNARAAAIGFLEGIGHGKRPLMDFTHRANLPFVDAGNGFDLGAVATENLLHRVGHFADRRPGARRIDAQRQQVALAGGTIGERGRARHQWQLGRARAQLQLRKLLLTHRGVIDLQDIQRLLALRLVAVDPDDGLLAAVDARLRLGRRFLDAHLRDAGFDGLGHAAKLSISVMCSIARAARSASAARRSRTRPKGRSPVWCPIPVAGKAACCGQCGRRNPLAGERFIQRIGVQALRVALRCRHRLHAGADHVVVDVLRGQRPAGGLAMGAQRGGFGFFGANSCCMSFDHSSRPARSLATSMKKFMPMAQKKERRGAKLSISMPAATPAPGVFDAVGQRVGKLQVRRRSGLLHVVAGDRDGVEFRHLPGRVGEDVGDDPHRGRGADRCRCCGP